MSCEIICAKACVFSVWGEPTWVDVDRVIEVVKTTFERSGEPLTYITRVPVNAPPPSATVRKHLDDVLPAAMKYFSSYHVVVEGDGFVSAMKRSVLVGLTQVTQRRGTFFVHAHVDDVLKSVSKAAYGEVKELLELAAARGLLQGNLGSESVNSRVASLSSSSNDVSPFSRYPGALAAIRRLTSRTVGELR